MIDLQPFLGEYVHIKICRRHKHKEYSGVLTLMSHNSVCLMIDNKRKWIAKPRFSRDTITIERM